MDSWGKRILSSVLTGSALGQRNMVSLGLVGVFFLIYILAGGKISTRLPDHYDNKEKDSQQSLQSEQTRPKKQKQMEQVDDNFADQDPDFAALPERQVDSIFGSAKSKASGEKKAQPRTEGKKRSVMEDIFGQKPVNKKRPDQPATSAKKTDSFAEEGSDNLSDLEMRLQKIRPGRK